MPEKALHKKGIRPADRKEIGQSASTPEQNHIVATSRPTGRRRFGAVVLDCPRNRGTITTALDGERLTIASLQKYLGEEVKRSIRTHHAARVNQTPRFFGSFETEGVVADLAHVLARIRDQAKAQATTLGGGSLLSLSNEPISSLSGFSKKRGHHVPDRVSEAVDEFIARIADDELRQHVEGKRDLIRKKFGYKLGDLTVDAADGAGHIRTPAFDYLVTVKQSHSDPSEAEWRYELTIADHSVVETDAFNEVFASDFDTVDFQSERTSAAIRKLAERLEDAGIEVEMPVNAEYCEFSTVEGGPRLRVGRESLRFVFDSPREPKELADGFRAAVAALGSGPAELRRLLPAAK